MGCTSELMALSSKCSAIKCIVLEGTCIAVLALLLTYWFPTQEAAAADVLHDGPEEEEEAGPGKACREYWDFLGL